jgi:hypothetical protein
MSKHTPTPWKIDDVEGVYATETNGQPVADCSFHHRELSQIQRRSHRPLFQYLS